jgi:hypothetical protein
MKLVSCRHIDIANLKGAVVTNTNGAEFYVLGFEVDVESHTINIVMQPTDGSGPVGLLWDHIKDWTIALQPIHWLNDILTITK